MTTSPPPPAFGRYEIKKIIGRGAMGLVYRATDPRIGRDVALKTLAPGLLGGDKGEQLTERFLNEGRAAGRLRHPAIVAIYDADTDPNTGVAYLAMEFIEGTDLRKRMKEGMQVDEFLEVLLVIADALHHAHEKGVIHRDVKPANVLLDTAGKPHLTDFGIARLGDSTLTQDGEFLGTPAYMAPEQVRARPVSPQTDVYALGVMLYEGLTGRRPFEGDSMVATATAIATDPPLPPSAAGFVSTAFDDVILKALAKDPTHRHESAVAFAEDVKRARKLAATDTATRVSSMDSPLERTSVSPAARGPGSRRLVIGGLALAAIALVVAFIVLGSGDGSDGAPDAAPDAAADAAPQDESAQPATTAKPRATQAAPPSRPARASAPPATSPARAPVVPTGAVAVRFTTPRKGILSVLDAGAEVGRIDMDGKRVAMKGMQYEDTATFKLPAGERSLSFVYTPDDGKSLTQAYGLDVKVDATQRLHVDVGTLGRKLQVRRDD